MPLGEWKVIFPKESPVVLRFKILKVTHGTQTNKYDHDKYNSYTVGDFIATPGCSNLRYSSLFVKDELKVQLDDVNQDIRTLDEQVRFGF